jgi:hypothetical protein
MQNISDKNTLQQIKEENGMAQSTSKKQKIDLKEKANK